MNKRALLLVAVITALSAEAQANMRAPQWIIRGPSSSLSIPPDSQITVRKEKLNIDCGYTDCLVQAVYYLTSDVAAELAFTFLLPTNTPVEARVSGTLQPTKVQRDENQPQTLPELYDKPLEFYQAAFTGKIAVGENIINIKYHQPLTSMERDYGYFSQSRFVKQFTYLLGPLKTWRLADNFTLDIILSSPRSRPDGSWSLLKSRTLDCLQPGQIIEKDSDHLNLALTFGKDFPDTLVCRIGDSDLLR